MSRKVRSFIQKEIYPHLPIEPSELPEICQLHPTNDLYLDQELNKTEVQRLDWKCAYCNKHFRTEFYLDRHMSTRHSDKLKVRSRERPAHVAVVVPVWT